ncbi:Nudix family hydrolase [Solimonas sp. SE-A11]|uniref:Nudix family hydrolase n=1 Tax=Solimonas sp. SE-A11 TaxID=3054954 RepID=UPI00259D0133|nr:Nudix family hydrolase [Solimonas sp. SE-A11]MDM4772795.1 Nudix family hydrolase [Solimonas sp. SE-A11]
MSDGAPTPAAKPVLAVACGVLVRGGRVLLAQRPVGKVAAGSWEFPGGKIEPGETTRQALERELHEELGVEVREARPLIRFRHEYSNRTVLLDTWLIDTFDGEPHGREEQALAWVTPEELAAHPQVLPTVLPIAGALRLPVDYVFTPADANEAFLLERLPRLPAGALLRLRRPGLDDAGYAVLARSLAPVVRRQGLRLLLDRDPALSAELGAGWHATSARLAVLERKPEGLECHASCHTPEELMRAAQLGFASAVLGPVRTTATHPGVAALGWERFADWIAPLQLPVYALGGVGPAQRDEAFAAYAQGVAGIRAYW